MAGSERSASTAVSLAQRRSARYRSRMTLAADRRAAARTPVQIFLNKYVDGVPHLCEAIELSMTGLLVRRVAEPDGERACYALEISHKPGSEPDERLWLCATPVWRSGRYEALGFVGQSHLDRLRLANLLHDLAA